MAAPRPSGCASSAGAHDAHAEGARAALRAGFETLGLAEIVSFVHPGNERSLAVTRRLGMSVEGEVLHPARPDTTVKILSIASAAAG